MEIDPVGGGAGVTSGASGSRPSATAAGEASGASGSWPAVTAAGEALGASNSGPAATAGRRRTPGRWRRIPRPGYRPKKEGTGPSEGGKKRTKKGVDQNNWLPTFRFEVVSDGKDPPTLKSVLVEEKIIPPPEISAVRNGPSTPTGLLQQRPLELDMQVVVKGSRECEEMEERSRQTMLEQAKRFEQEADEGLCDTEEHTYTEEEKAEFRAHKLMCAAAFRSTATTKPVLRFKPPSDTIEEHLTAEEMERQAIISGWPVCSQAQHFATLALQWYNSTKKTHKFEIGKVLLSKCFTDVDYNTYAHVNFTATPTSLSHSPKRLFFAELMLAPNLLSCKDTEPMRVLSVSTIDDSCFGGCHEMVRDIKGPVRKNMDYERCHACSERIKHPRGNQFVAGHNRTRMPYFSCLPSTYKSQ